MSQQLPPLQKAVSDIALQSPFLARSLLSLDIAPDRQVRSMCTDGQAILYNQKWIDSLSTSQIAGAIVHELMHILPGHHLRLGGRDLRRANVAMDYAINPLVLAAGYELPGGALLDSRYDGMAWEQIYELLPERIADEAGHAAACGEVAPAKDLVAATEEWRAMLSAMRWGVLPAGLDRAVATALSPPSCLADRIRHWLHATCPGDDRQFCRLSRRNDLLPGIARRPQGRIGAAIDTSGSVCAADLALFAAALTELAAADIGDLTLVFADAAVAAVVAVETAADVAAAFGSHCKGGGGTDFRPALMHLADQDAIIYLTDGEGQYPASAPDAPVLWAMTTAAVPPFGAVETLP